MSISTKTGSPRKLFARILPFIFLFAALVLSAPLAHAQALGIDPTKIPKPKPNEQQTKEGFENATKKITEEDPYNEPEISYTLRVPKSWSDNVQKAPIEASGKSMLSGNVLGLLGRYISPPKNLVRSYITVEAQTLTYEISAQNWFVYFILRNGFSLTALEEYDSRHIQALYVQVIKDQTFVVRTRVMLNGPNLVIVRYYLPQENYNDEKGQQEQVMNSFALTDISNEKIEKQAKYGFLDQSFFNYPASWTLKDKSILSVERMSVLLYQATTKDQKKLILDGHIKVHVISRLLKTTMADEVEHFRQNLQTPNYTIGNRIEEVSYQFDPSITTGRAEVYKLIPKDPVTMKAYELLVALMEGEDYYYIVSLITPSREQDFYSWAQNMEAARILIETLRRNDIALNMDPNDPYFDYLKDLPPDDPAPTQAPAPTTAPAPAPAAATN